MYFDSGPADRAAALPQTSQKIRMFVARDLFLQNGVEFCCRGFARCRSCGWKGCYLRRIVWPATPLPAAQQEFSHPPGAKFSAGAQRRKGEIGIRPFGPEERVACASFRATHGISDEQHREALARAGWSNEREFAETSLDSSPMSSPSAPPK